jgi:hypothetical protein
VTTQPTRAETEEASPVECLAGHRHLVESARELMRRLPLRAQNSIDLLRLGATCITLAAEQAFGERDERRAAYLWAQCDAGEQQIRRATYHALRNGYIRNRDYDALFLVARDARQARRAELDRLRRKLRQRSMI